MAQVQGVAGLADATLEVAEDNARAGYLAAAVSREASYLTYFVSCRPADPRADPRGTRLREHAALPVTEMLAGAADDFNRFSMPKLGKPRCS